MWQATIIGKYRENGEQFYLVEFSNGEETFTKSLGANPGIEAYIEKSLKELNEQVNLNDDKLINKTFTLNKDTQELEVAEVVIDPQPTPIDIETPIENKVDPMV